MAQTIEQMIIPKARQLPGYRGGYWFGDRASGKGLAVNFYDSEESLRSSAEAAGSIRDQAAQASGTNVAGVEDLEVVADTGQKIHRSATHARVTRASVDPSRAAEGLKNVRDKVIPETQAQPGFAGGFWLSDRQGKVLGVTLWDSADSLAATRDFATQRRQEGSESFGVQFDVEEMEIVARAEPLT